MRPLIAAVLAALLSACASAPAEVTPSPEPTAVRTETATVAPTSTPSPSPSARPSPTPVADPSQVVQPLAIGWRATVPTLVLADQSGSDIRIVAQPFGPTGTTAASTPLVRFPAGGGWQMRSDGAAVVTSVWDGHGARIASWDVRSGLTRWVTPDEPDVSHLSPIWSADGASIYYSATREGGDVGIFRIGLDGTGQKRLRDPERFGGQLVGLTPDGNGLVWSRTQAGGSLDILDLTTLVSRKFDDVARVDSWRTQRPRALVTVGGCCAGRPGGTLVLWDDIAMTSRVLVERSPAGGSAVGGASWDPTGTRIVVRLLGSDAPYEGTLATLDPATGALADIPRTKGAYFVRWLSEGIVFARVLQSGFDVLLLSQVGGSPVVVYQGSGSLVRIDVVRP